MGDLTHLALLALATVAAAIVVYALLITMGFILGYITGNIVISIVGPGAFTLTPVDVGVIGSIVAIVGGSAAANTNN